MILSRVLLVPFVAVMLVFGSLVYHFAMNIRSQAGARLEYIANAHRDLIEEFLREKSFDIQYIAASNSFEELGQDKRLSEVLKLLQGQSGAFLDLGVFDGEGNHIAYVGPFDLEGKNYSTAEWFLQVQKTDVYISDVFMGYRNIPHFVIAVHRNEEGRTWYLRATIDTHYFENLVESVRVGKTGEAYLINKEGVFQTRRRSGGELMQIDPDHVVYQTDGSAISSFTADDRVGNRHLYATCRLSSTGWLLVVRQETGDAYAPLMRATLLAITLIVAGGAVVVTMGFFLATGVANQLTVAQMEKRQMGSQLIMAGKFAEIGEMSAGVAHEINNPLQVMKSEEALSKELLQELEATFTPEQRENIQMVKDSINRIGSQIDRCKRITLSLLKFARESETTIQTIDFQPFISDIVGMVERRAAVENIKIIEKFDDNLPRFQTDPAQLQQVFLNLLNNAIDALDGKDEAQIQMTATQGGDDLIVTVADNGCGIPPENIEKIFLPFFTTKPVGRGTGLGLSTCYGIVERLGGKIEVTSELNVGTVFTIRLPLSGLPGGARNLPPAKTRG